MLNKLRKMLRPEAEKPSPGVPAGTRVYAIGDVHGRLDLLEMMIAEIDADHARRGPAEMDLILLGDLVDRGPESAGVIDYVRELVAKREAVVLFGNHEEMFLKSFQSQDTLRQFIRVGGRETILSYPIERAEYNALNIADLQKRMTAIVPEAHVAFLKSMVDCHIVGDYAFVHAGIRPGVPLDKQNAAELRWMREPFLSERMPHSHIIVHGHTITETVDERSNRIGIDTGAFMSGRLTAIGLEGTKRWFLEAKLETAEQFDSAYLD